MLDLPMFAIVLKKDNHCVSFVSAKNKQQAWEKFVRQRFDALKPDPDDYEVKDTNIEHQWGPDGFIVLEHITRTGLFAYEPSDDHTASKQNPLRTAKKMLSQLGPCANAIREEQYQRLQQKLADSKQIKHVVACTNANGESDFFFCYAKDAFVAISKAEEEGYEAPFVVFDEQDRCFKNGLENLFQWESLK